jgi:hypothetical protein
VVNSLARKKSIIPLTKHAFSAKRVDYMEMGDNQNALLYRQEVGVICARISET